MNVVDILQDKKNFIFMQHLLKVLCHICDVVIQGTNYSKSLQDLINFSQN